VRYTISKMKQIDVWPLKYVHVTIIIVFFCHIGMFLADACAQR